MGVPVGGRTGQLLCVGVELQQVGNVRYGRGSGVEL
jgi:hypothetical protein